MIKILNLKINHYLSRLTMCKQPIRIKNKEIKAKRIQNKKDWFRGKTLVQSLWTFCCDFQWFLFQIFNKPKKRKEAAKKMKQKYSKKKVVWNNKRAKWKLKLKRIQILISKTREKQSKFY